MEHSGSLIRQRAALASGDNRERKGGISRKMPGNGNSMRNLGGPASKSRWRYVPRKSIEATRRYEIGR